MYAMDRPDLAEDPRFQNNKLRSEHADFLDSTIEDWTKSMTLEEVLKVLDEAEVPAGSIYSIEDIVYDPQYQSRDMICEVDIEGLGN